MTSNNSQSEAARSAAKRIYQRISYSGGPLQTYEISTLLQQTYDFLKIPYKPSARDIKAYSDILDTNKDGKVTLSDLETLAVLYLSEQGVLFSNKQSQNYQLQKDSFRKGPINQLNNRNIQNKLQDKHVSSDHKYRQNSSKEPIHPKPQNHSQSSYANQQNIHHNKSNLSEAQQQSYNQKTIYYLNITRKIFERLADQHFTITSKSVPDLLSLTYQTLGRKGYRPNEQDVRVWMKLCDGNGDGHVQYEEYEYFVVRSLQRSGFNVYS